MYEGINAIPVHFSPSPTYPDGQASQTAPVPGATTSKHSTPWKQISSEQPFLSSSQYLPCQAV